MVSTQGRERLIMRGMVALGGLRGTGDQASGT